MLIALVAGFNLSFGIYLAVLAAGSLNDGDILMWIFNVVIATVNLAFFVSNLKRYLRED